MSIKMKIEVAIFIWLAIFGRSLTSEDYSDIIRARIESCRGCRLNRLDQVRAFVFDDVPHYNNVEFKPIQGAPPQLVLLTDQDKEVDRIDLAPLNRQECNDLLHKYGFRRKDAPTEKSTVPKRDDF